MTCFTVRIEPGDVGTMIREPEPFRFRVTGELMPCTHFLDFERVTSRDRWMLSAKEESTVTMGYFVMGSTVTDNDGPIALDSLVDHLGIIGIPGEFTDIK